MELALVHLGVIAFPRQPFQIGDKPRPSRRWINTPGQECALRHVAEVVAPGISYEIPPPVAGTAPGSRPTSIPVQAIVDLYHELLPMCPRIQKITKARAGAIQARWRSGDLPDLETWADYFRYVSESAFLTGRVDPAPGRTRFVADLEWLAREGNYAKVYEGKFHRSKA